MSPRLTAPLVIEHDAYTRFALRLILARFPEWEPYCVASPRQDGAGSTVEFIVPCPNPAVESGLYVSTAADELTIGFHTDHGHFTDFDSPLNRDRIEQGLNQAAAYLEDRLGAVSWYQGERLLGTTSCELPLDGPLPPMFATYPVTHGTLRSWSGRFDRDEP
jgi:hypothetical protein